MKPHNKIRWMAVLFLCCLLFQSLSTFAAGTQNAVSTWEETFYNEAESHQITVEKRDADTDALLAGAVFGLYLAEDIVTENGRVLVPEGTLMETAVTNAAGLAQFTVQYPQQKYRICELIAPTQYELAADTELALTEDVTVTVYDEEETETETIFLPDGNGTAIVTGDTDSGMYVVLMLVSAAAILAVFCRKRGEEK